MLVSVEASSPLVHTVRNTDNAAAPRAREDQLRPGTAIRRYVVLERLGAGGMGVVYAAYDYALDRSIALKLVRHRGGAAARARLMREAQVLAKLSHPNVVAVYDIGEHDGEVYVAMELVAGSSLRRWLAAEPRDWRAILDVFRRAGQGLAAAHRAGIVHRDVKPDNILIDRRGAVRVGDFGIAMICSGDGDDDRKPITDGAPTTGTVMTEAGAAIGTPMYMAPEQYAGSRPAGREIDARADQFGFCVALYEALYGVLPFAGDDSVARRAAIEAGRLTAPPAAPLTTRDVPSWVRRAIVRGLAADPAARFPSMTALLAELDRDPRARRRRIALGTAAITALTGAAVCAAVIARSEPIAVCRPDAAQFAGAWDAPRKQAILAAFTASGAPDAGDAWQRVERALDARAAGWQRMRIEACEATRVRGEQSVELLDRRMACLDDRAGELRALTDLLVVPDRRTVGRAVAAIDGLDPLEACSRGAALRTVSERASDGDAAGRRDRLARAEAVSLVGDRARAFELMTGVARDARSANDRELESRADRALGELYTERGDIAGAEDVLYRAIAAAVASNADELAALAWLDLLWLVGEEHGRHAEALQLAVVAQATIDRLGGMPSLQAMLEDRIGVVLFNQGNYGDAGTRLERSLAIREQLYGPTSRVLSSSLQHLAILRSAEGNHELALALHRRARENAERASGPYNYEVLGLIGGEGVALYQLGRHAEALALFERALTGTLRNDPDDERNAAVYLNNISTIQRERGQLAAAQASAERALAMFERVSGADRAQLVEPLTTLALALGARGDYAKAVVRLERALAIRQAQPGAPTELAEQRFQLARALIGANGDRARALGLADAARAAFDTAGDSAATARIDTWRATIAQRDIW